MKVINDMGMQQIKTFLGEKHLKPLDWFTDRMLSTWAAEAESHYDDHGVAYIEISSRDSVTGNTELLTLEENCLAEYQS